jgi:hypothetical protein
MKYQALPLFLALPESGSGWPEAFPAERQAALKHWLRPADAALARVFALEHRTPHILAGDLTPLLLTLDAPLRQALAVRDPERKPLYVFGYRARQACQRQLRQAYQSFHDRVAEILGLGKVRAALDCRVRPLPSLKLLLGVGNNGDVTGAARPGAGSLTCPADQARNLRDLLAARFSDLAGKVGLNLPDRGSAFGLRYRRFGVPWLTLDLAPQLLLGSDGQVSCQRVQRLQERLEAVLFLWCKLEGWIGESPA